MTAIDITTRRKFFYLLVALFVLGVPLILLYSQGFVLDVRTRGLVQTGGIFVKTIQSGAKIYIDNDLYDKTSFISHGALMNNLFPKRYVVRVEKEGYRSWQKVVRVSDEEVLEFRNVFLPPATVTPVAVFNTRRNSETRLSALEGSTDILLSAGKAGEALTLFLVNPETRKAPLNTVKVSQWVWDPLSKSLFLGRGESGRYTWYRLNTTTGGGEMRISFRGLPEEFSAERITPHPLDSEEFYFFAGGALFLQGRSSIPIPIAEQVETYALTHDHLYFLAKNGFFVEADLEGANTHVLGRRGLFIDDEHPPRIIPSPTGDIAVIDSAGGLYLFRPGVDQELQLIAGNINQIDFSKNSDRLLLSDGNRLWIYWLRDNSEQPFDLAKSRREIFVSDAPIRSAFLDAKGAHVYFATDDAILVTEVDNRAGTNRYVLVNRPIGSFLFNRDRLTLFWTEGSALFQTSLQ